MGVTEEECDRLRGLLGLSHEPGTPCGHQDAGVLILLDGTPDNYKVFLCIRSEQMRRHPGEVCFPGGMRDNGENMQETAIREAEERTELGGANVAQACPVCSPTEQSYTLILSIYVMQDASKTKEVGLLRDDFILLGSLPSFRARFGVLIHPTVALLRRPFFPRLNVQEVQDVFWMPLERFLDDSVHMAFVVDSNYAVHSFSFEEAHTYGVTALICVITAIGVLQKMPTFELSPLLPVSRLALMKPSEVISQVCEYASQPFATQSKL